MMFGWEISQVAPAANAGGPYTVASAGKATLAGSATGSAPMTYLWSASAGTFSDPTILNPVYTAPAVNSNTVVNLTLTATNAKGSNTASTTITVSPSVITETITITSSVYRVSKKTLTITATTTQAAPGQTLKLMPYLTTANIMYDPSGNSFKLSKGKWSLTLSGVPQPAAGIAGEAGLQVKSSLGGISPKTALGSVTK